MSSPTLHEDAKSWAATQRVLSAIRYERQAQDAKWGEQNHPDGTGPLTLPLNAIAAAGHYAAGYAITAKGDTDRSAKNGTLTYRQIFLEEVFEALAEADPEKLRAELIQVAAVATAWIEAIDRRLAGGSNV